MKYSRAVKPSRKFDRIGSGMMRPEGSAIKPRIPANWEIGWYPPFVAPEFAIVAKLPFGSSVFLTLSDRSMVVFCQISISRSFCSCSVSKPRRKSRWIPSACCKEAAMISPFSSGMVISDTASVIPDRVA